MRHVRVFVGVLLVGSGLVAAAVVAAGDHPPRPGTDGSDLDENESATLWSKESNECLSDEEFQDKYGKQRSDFHGLGDCSDITFAEPPDTAQRWTEYDFDSLDAGGSQTSVAPENRDRTSSGAIEDAHATIFSAQPSTILHRGPDDVPHFVAPEGELRGLVDYRVDVPRSTGVGNITTTWSLIDHDITEVRLLQDEVAISKTDGTHKPVLSYDLTGQGASTLTLEADITATLEREVSVRRGNTTRTVTRTYDYDTTVSDSREFEVYNLTAEVHHALLPEGDRGAAIYQSQPWHGYSLDREEAAVRGVWRYYTARDTDWDHLAVATDSGETTVQSTSLPVYVRAYPSELGPRADPIWGGPDIREVWGTEGSSPNGTLHENVEIDIVDQSYTRSYGLAVQYPDLDPNDLEVQGIVHGSQAEIVEPEDGPIREVRESDLSVEILDRDQNTATLRIELRDSQTGNPIVLDDPTGDDLRLDPITTSTRRGFITVDGQYLLTDDTGTATATVTEPGSYTVEYHSGTWRTHDPAYTSEQTSVRWHPLLTQTGWFMFFFEIIWILIPFLVALYAGLKLGSFVKTPEHRYP